MEKKTLWMGAVQDSWDENFLMRLFKSLLDEEVTVKLFKNNLANENNNHKRPIGYAFIEFSSFTAAKKAKEKLANEKVPGTNVVFRLNWAVRDKKKTKESKNLSEYSMFVGDLCDSVSDEVLFEFFRRDFNSCTSASVVIDPTTGHSRKYGFVHFTQQKDYIRALETKNGAMLGSRAIRVNKAVQKQKHHSNPAFLLQHPLYSYQQPSLQQFKVPDLSLMSTIYISNLQAGVTENNLASFFGYFGTIVRINLRDFKPGFASIQYSTPLQAQTAAVNTNNQIFGKTVIKVNVFSQTRQVQSAQNVGMVSMYNSAINFVNVTQKPIQAHTMSYMITKQTTYNPGILQQMNNLSLNPRKEDYQNSFEFH